MPHYERSRQVTRHVAVLLQDNPGPMTLDGTNTWLLRAPGARESVVVDPGETDGAHLEAVLRAAGDVAAIVLTHRHPDHAQAAPALHERTGAPVLAADPQLGIDAEPLTEGREVTAAGVALLVMATPGHTSDSTSFLLDSGPVLTGDTILGRGSTVVTHPDGNLGAYLASVARLRDLGDRLALPGHGPQPASVREVADAYLRHRHERLGQVRAALARLGQHATAKQVVEHVYADVDCSLWPAAEQSVRAQLDYLNDDHA